MMPLSGTAIILGILISIIYAPLMLIPDQARTWLNRFPRSRPASWLLVAIDFIWVVWLLHHAQLGRFEGLKSWLYLLGPVCFVVVIYFMDELLAPRALGGLLLLVPVPLLVTARWHDSGFRLVIVVLAYVLVVKGIILVLSPYLFRKTTAFLFKNNRACRAWVLIGLGFGIFVLYLGMTVF